jgi:phospholipid/cholesterol/gamma-HCH transport system permease protein
MRGMRDESPARAELVVREEGERTILEPHGDWVIDTIGRHDNAIRAVEASADPCSIVVDVSHLGRVDTAGAYLLGRATRKCPTPDADFHFVGQHRTVRRLIEEVRMGRD